MESYQLFISTSARKGFLRGAWVLVAPDGQVREVVWTHGEGSVARAGLVALSEGLEAAPVGQIVHVCAYDQGLVDVGREHLLRWRDRGWRRKGKKLKGLDLLQRLVQLMEERDVRWSLVERTHPALVRSRQLCRLDPPTVRRVPLPPPTRPQIPPVSPAPQRVLAYTDGGCRDNPGGPGGWAFLLVDTTTGQALERAGGEAATTNNRMELLAAIQALEALRGGSRRVVVRSDSRYLVDLCTNWLPGWKLRGWKRSSGEPVRNLDLVQRLDALMAQHFVHWEWVKAHAGEAGNEHVDGLASRALDRVSEGEDPSWERRYDQSPVSLGEGLKPS